FIAAGLGHEDLRRFWLEFRKWKPFRFNWEVLWKWRQAQSLFDPSGFRRFLADSLPAKSFEDLKTPLTVVATNLQKAESIHLEQGDLIFAVMASISLPLYFPPLFLDGEQIVDGGVTNNVPLDVAVAKGATRVYAMPCGCQEEMRRPVSGFLNLESRAFQIATRQKYYWDMEHLKDKAELIVLSPCLTFAKNVLDFSQSERIMEEAYQYAISALPAQIKERR
ncbi:MAG: patatin-like phospholipase family protein, partial [Elusimicrobia bacterium]|nr:patatin-like phospholipase family protein [Elusimicrobiota bacterium]